MAYVFGAGKAVVSTPYWHAQELLANGRGTLVPFRDPPAIADAVLRYLNDPGLLEKTRRNAHEMGRQMIWPATAERYLDSFNNAIADRAVVSRRAFAEWTLAERPYQLPLLRFDHMVRMSDRTGIFQHALFNVPNYEEGYCIDDNARAFMLCCLLDEAGGQASVTELEQHTSVYLSFIAAALNTVTGKFRNFMSFGREWLEHSGSEDSHGRALWALGTGAGRAREDNHRKLSMQLFQQALGATDSFSSPRAWAFTLLGLHEYLQLHPDDESMVAARRKFTARLVSLWEHCATDDWPWFEETATYDNARLCQALLQSGRMLRDERAFEIGLKSLQWLDSVQETQDHAFRPIGSNGFYARGGARADFDQQPVEACAMVSSCLEAFRATKDEAWVRAARRTFEWFLGRNDLGIALYDSGGGGCADGLHADRINENQGAESTLAFQLARVEMKLSEQQLVITEESPV